MHPVTRSVLVVFAAFVAGCGGNDASGPDGGGDYLTATVNGSSFAADAVVSARLLFGTLDIQGSKGPFGQTMALFLSVHATAPGSYVIGMGGGSNSGSIQEGNATGGVDHFGTVYGGTGSVVITELTATRVTGTFEFNAPAAQGSTSQTTRVVTNGKFRITLETSSGR